MIPALRYRDLGAAVVWLCDAFDFEKSKVFANEDGHVIYAELSFGDSMLMLGSMSDQNVGRLLKQPDEIGGAETQTCYLLVDDVDAHYERAKKAGAQFASVITHNESGARSFGCRDLEGHIWFFGEHAPRPPEKKRGSTSRQVFAAAMIVALVVGLGAWGYASHLDLRKRHTVAEQQALSAQERATRERSLRESSAQALDELKSQLVRFRRARDEANDAMIEATSKMTAERVARAKTDRELREMQQQLERQQGATETIKEKNSRLRQELLAEREQGEKREQLAAAELAKDRAANLSANVQAAARATAERATRAKKDRKFREMQQQLATQQGAAETIREKLANLRRKLLAERKRSEQRQRQAAVEFAKERAAHRNASFNAKAAMARIKELQAEVIRLETAKTSYGAAKEKLKKNPAIRTKKVSKRRSKKRRISATRKLRTSTRTSKQRFRSSSDIRLRVRVR
ncbi:MAG: VOC family protein [Hyphomicrobiaceae bacterium]